MKKPPDLAKGETESERISPIRECKLCTRPAAGKSEFCERHVNGIPVAEDYKPKA